MTNSDASATIELPTIVVCDDDSRRVETWAGHIRAIPAVRKRYETRPLRPEQFAAAYRELKKRQRQARAGELSDFGGEAEAIDKASIVVMDFDLTPTNGSGDLDDTTLDTLSGSFGDNLAFLTRCYATARFIVLVNQDFSKTTFDLTHQNFALSSADLNIAHDDLRRAELWTGQSDGIAYRPWHWPRLLDAPDRLARLANEVDLEAPVLETLGLDDDETYAQFAKEQLELFGEAPRELTFRAAAERLTRAMNRLSFDETIPDSLLPMVAVASVAHWLERVVLPGQNVLIDAPHLAHRRPGLLVDPRPSSWGQLSDLSQPEAAAAAFDSDLVSPAWCAPVQRWLSRPVWLWHLCPRSRGPVPREPHVFCEDVSAFHPIHAATEYVSSVPGPFKQRFVLRDGVRSGGFDVDYWPEIRLFADAEE
ncbi:hypothetical protein [Actinotalea ferrariae]|uniref:hypothetical protein n=1 Tax=Actinotalea ferrariae TaxID=1386098 RepID=UPI001C8CC984|nr:hypothetical protein [Actinotalea ferrariae]